MILAQEEAGNKMRNLFIAAIIFGSFGTAFAQTPLVIDGWTVPTLEDQQRDPEGTWRRIQERHNQQNAKRDADFAKGRAELKALVERERRCAAGKPLIGMTTSEARQAWCKPDHINTTETSSRIIEQWVYPDRGYLYFRDGRLVTIQRTNE